MPPASLLDALARPGTVLLDPSRTDPDAPGAPARLFADPARVLCAETPADVPGVLRAVDAAVAGGRFVAGYLAYEAGYPFAQLPTPAARPAEPLAWFGVYDAPQRLAPAAVADALARLPATAPATASAAASVRDAHFGVAQADYLDTLAAVRAHIQAGDVYQINVTGPLGFRFGGDARALYARMRARQPVPYGAFVHVGTHRILSASPELFFRLGADQRVTTRPMKGTIRRGATPAEDARLRAHLAADAKSRAENLMIVDLLRNDLSVVSEVGSVAVPALFATETHPTVTQMTSTVTSRLRPGVTLAGVLRALFPCGSVTGAPKRRAMQIIERLEAGPRGVYCGALGFAGPAATGGGTEAVFSVPIRTAVVDAAGRGRLGIGSGVVWDSVPADEYAECLLKARFLTDQPPSASTDAAPPSTSTDAAPSAGDGRAGATPAATTALETTALETTALETTALETTTLEGEAARCDDE